RRGASAGGNLDRSLRIRFHAAVRARFSGSMPYVTAGAQDPSGGDVNRQQRVAELRRRREQSLAGGGPERVAKLHAKGCLTARERLELLLDPGSFVEIGAFVTHRSTDFGMDEKRITGDGVVAGWGTVDGRLVYC